MERYSVLMSLYTKENPEFLRIAIDSMLNQTVKPSEIVIVRDGPLTETLDFVVKDYNNEDPNLFKIITNEKNLGLGLALNNGLKVCSYEFVARMDTDDISKSDRCEKQLNCFEADSSLSIVGAWADEFYDDPNIILSTRNVPVEHKDIYEFAKRRSAFNHPVVMYRKSKVLSNHGYSDLRRNQDVDLFGRMLFNGCKAYNIPESLLLFRSNDALKKRRKSWENTTSYIGTIKKFWKMGYSSFGDYALVACAQMVMFLCPIRFQQWMYKKFLRNKV